MRRRGLVIAAILIVGASISVSAPASAIQTGDAISATMPPGSHLSTVGRYYLLNARPGDSITQHVLITNTNTHAVTASVEAVDAKTGNETGVALGAPGSPKALVSRWVSVSTPQMTMNPSTQRDVAFTVHVPTNTTPGQYLTAISASVPLHPEGDPHGTRAPNQAGFALSVQFQRAIAVEIDVPGPRAPQLVVTGADPSATTAGVQLGLHIANQGNAFAHGSGTVRVVDTQTDYSFKIDTFVPGTSIVFPVPWTKSVVAGVHQVQVDLNYEGGRRTSWNGTVNIAGADAAKLQQDLNNITVRHKGATDPMLIVAALVVLALMAGAIRMRRRSRRPALIKYQATSPM